MVSDLIDPKFYATLSRYGKVSQDFWSNLSFSLKLNLFSCFGGTLSGGALYACLL
ncbi:hypothetical protein MIDIC_540008 [Alphaproteobacteria bacterium]